MAATKHSKAFYNTEIPSDWEIVKVLDFGKVYTGNTPLTSESENYDGSYLFVSPGDLSEAKYIDKTEKTLTEKGFATSRKFPKGSVLFTCIGSTIGKSGIATVDLTANQQINAIVVNDMNSNEYLYYQLEMNVNRIKLIAGEQAVPIINKSQFESIKLPKAPLPEQKAIARVLSTADAAIHTTEKLIAQKELRKKWLMQQLLTGKKRLKGFGWEWKEYPFEKLLKVVKRPVKWDDSALYKLISVRRRSGGIFFREALFGHQIKVKDLRDAEVGDFLFSKMQIVHGASALVTKEFEGAKISGSYIATVAKDPNILNMDFFNWYSQLLYFYHQALISSYGVHIEKMTFDFDTFLQLEMKLPSVEEQTAIAQVLQAADKEISLLKAKAEKMREQKKGLMQVLLTGKVRLKTNEKLCS